MLSLITIAFVPLLLIEWRYGSSFRAARAAKVLVKEERQDARRVAHEKEAAKEESI